MDHWTFGLGISQSSVSNDFSTIADVDDITQIEAYAKYNLHQSFHLTASIQNIKNSGFGELTTIDNDPNILTLRATYEF